MKQGTTEKVKFKKLKRRLSLPEWQCIGLLESIWRLTAETCDRGGIGKLSPEDIAASIEYQDGAQELFRHLLECEYIKPHPEFRYIVCDWERIRRGRTGATERSDLQTAEWRRLRLEIISERGPFCHYCGCDCSDDPTVDHIVPVSRGGTNDRSNLVVACRRCNGRKADSIEWSIFNG